MGKCKCFDCGKVWWTIHPTWLCKDCREKRFVAWKKKKCTEVQK